jgi:extracellular factor (EF) 3-hydroxypalmitic acid methyl ester biosynthesis protein
MEVAVSEQSSADEVGPRSKRFSQLLRSNRIQLGGPDRAEVVVTGQHSILGTLVGSALDLSIHGARVALTPTRAWEHAIGPGDRVGGLSMRLGQATVYEGAATVVRVKPAADGCELGLALEDASIDLEALYQIAARHTARERWAREREKQTFGAVSSEFRRWVEDLRDDLAKARVFLDAEESATDAWDLASRTAVSKELLDAVAPDVVERMNRAGAELRGLVGHLPRALHEEYRAYTHKELGSLLATSPFLNRARTKPLGYAGDYEMMNMLYREHAEGTSLFGKALNLYATQSPVAQANINRIEFLGRKIEAALASRPGERVRIASVGCGPAQEIQTFLTKRPELGRYLEVALIDQEERAISYCERVLAPLAARTHARVRVIRESVRRLLTDKRLAHTLGACELIYSAGLFDYLNDRTFEALIGTLYSAVAKGGVLAIGNVAALNPDRFAMEYFTEWYLNHRSPEELRARTHALSPAPSKIEIESEPLGVNLFLILER